MTGRSRAVDVIAGRDNIIDHNGGTGGLNHFFDHFFDDHGRTFVIGGRHNSLTGRRVQHKICFRPKKRTRNKLDRVDIKVEDVMMTNLST